MGNFFSNLFGKIAGANPVMEQLPNQIRFIPINNQGDTFEFNTTGQVSWLGLSNRVMQLWAYKFCYPVAAVVDRLAEADLNGEVEILRSKGKGKEDYATSPYAVRMNRLFAQPNPLQSWEQFRGQQLVYKRVFGFCPVLPVMPAGMDTDPSYCLAMVNLPPWLFSAVPVTKGFAVNQIDMASVVKEYRLDVLGKTVTFKPEQIIILEDSFHQDDMCDFLLPQSRLVGLDMVVSNLCAALEADNVLLRKRGPLGFISHDAAATKDAIAGYLPMTKEEKRELQESLTQYGITWDQYQYVISRTAVRWNPVSFDVKQLGTKETAVSAEKAICHRFGYSYILYEDSGGTFSNQSGAHKALYQNVVIPNANKDIRKYAKFFQAEENACEFEVCFDDLPILQEDRQSQATADKTQTEALEIEYKNNLIDSNEWRTARGYDTRPDPPNTVPDPLAIRLGVGGTDALITVLTNPALNQETKAATLVMLFGLTEEQAKELTKNENVTPQSQSTPAAGTPGQLPPAGAS